MTRYTHAKVTENGLEKPDFYVEATDMKSAIEKIKQEIPKLRQYHDAERIIILSGDRIDEGENSVFLHKGTDF